MVNAELEVRADALAGEFAAAEPFPHLVLDGFLEPAAVAALLAEFPAFERGSDLNENGAPGNKAVFEDIRALGPAFRALDELFAGRRFLGLLERITGISGLLHDPSYLGGGTHENRAGQELDPHVDFNHHPTAPWHRRLNLLFYLNDEWRPEWGGGLELHRDPWTGELPAATVLPLCNRCVLFETSDHSWHGFSAIRAPVPRRSIAAYFYVAAAEQVPSHSTIYVERRLPPEMRAGAPSAPLAAWLDERIERRREHLRRLGERDEEMLETVRARLDDSLRSSPHIGAGQLATARFVLARYDEQLRAFYQREPALRDALGRLDPLSLGPALGDGLTLTVPPDGIWADAWVAAQAHLRVEPNADIAGVRLAGRVPAQLPRQSLRAVADGVELAPRRLAPGPFTWDLPSLRELELIASTTFSPARLGESSDGRELAWLLDSLTVY